MTRRSPRIPARLLAGAWIVFSGAAAVAQGFSIPRIDFEFANPGARSLAMGGAFAALADDATAAYANPAGLVQLTHPEVSLAVRSWNLQTPFLAGGRVDGVPTGIGIDTVQGPVLGRAGSETSGLGFVSYVHPRGRWTLALYRQELARYDVAAESQGFFFEDDGVDRFPASREAVALDLANTGLSAGWEVNDRLSLGMGIVLTSGRLATSSDLFFPSAGELFSTLSLEGEPDLTSDVVIDDSGFAVNLGVLWRLTERWTSGLFLRQGAALEGSFDLRSTLFGTPEAPLALDGVSRLKVPDIAGLGVAWRAASGRLTLSAEGDRVGYSDFVKVGLASGGELSSTLETVDAWEYRLGAEYALLRRSPIVAFRGGAWRDTRDDLRDPNDHWSLGVGVAASRFQIDLGADFSDNSDTVALSAVWSF